MQCEKCKAKWELQDNQKVTKCPFCQEPLASEIPQVAPDSNEAKILQIVKDKGVEIYTKKTFIALISDYFPNDDFGGLLKVVIEKQGAVEVLKLKDCPEKDMQINYNKLIDKLARKSYIEKEKLTPAVDLLCFGLGLSVKSPAPTKPIPPLVPTPPLSDFTIVNGELKKYKGSDSVVVIPNSVTSIGYNAFEKCTSLTQVTIPNSVTSIGGDAFSECTSLTEITIPNSVTYIGYNAFEKCTSLTQVTIPNSVTSIGGDAFKKCTSLTEITIPNSVTSIGAGVFDETPWYNKLSEKFNIVGAGVLIKYCGDDSQITIPNSVTSIGFRVFAGCTSLCQLTIPNSVTSIAQYVFSSCTSLCQVTIPDSVTSIGDSAFIECDDLPEDVVQQIKRINPEAFNISLIW